LVLLCFFFLKRHHRPCFLFFPVSFILVLDFRSQNVSFFSFFPLPASPSFFGCSAASSDPFASGRSLFFEQIASLLQVPLCGPLYLSSDLFFIEYRTVKWSQSSSFLLQPLVLSCSKGNFFLLSLLQRLSRELVSPHFFLERVMYR